MEEQPLPPYVQHPIKQAEKKAVSVSFEDGGTLSGKLECVLTLLFDASVSNKDPVLFEGDPESILKGTLCLKLAQPRSIKTITFGVDGEFLLGGVIGLEENYFLLKKKHCLWKNTDGEPRTSLTDSTPPLRSTFQGSLQGDYTWPISIQLPKNVVLKMKDVLQTFPLPQSFVEPFIRATIRYTAWIKVAQHGFLASNRMLNMPFTFLRITRPPPLPSLRQVAYQEGTPLLTPTIYPDGWHTEGPVHLEGKLAKAVPFSVQCTLYLGSPLSYSSGSVIPLFLRIKSDNLHALALLSTPEAIHVRIRRHIVEHVHVQSIFDNNSFRDSLDYSQRAVWWASDEQPDSERVRLMNGEIHLKKGMYPTTQLGHFAVKYSVMMYDFDATGLEFEEKKFIQETPIEICTLFGPGQRPKATIPHNTEPDVGDGKLIVPYMNEYSKGFY